MRRVAGRVLACATIAPGLRPVVHREARSVGLDPVDDDLDNAGWATFEADGPEAVVDALARMRTLHRLGLLLARGRVDPEEPWEGLDGLVGEIDVAPHFAGGPFAVRGHRSGSHPFTSMDVAAHVGGRLHDHLATELGTRPEVDLDDPEAIVRVHVDDDGRVRIWLDLAGQASLHRRGYRVYDHPAGMKASLACALLELAEPSPTARVGDPMGGGGTLVIEAAWRALGVSPIHRREDDLLAWNAPLLSDGRDRVPDTEPGSAGGETRFVLGDHAPNHVEGAQRNLEAAGVAGIVDTYAGDVTELPEHADELDLVVSNLPYGLRSGEGPLDETYRDWIETALAVLAPSGRLGLMTPKTKLVASLADENGLTVAERLDVQHGRLEIALIVLEP